MESFVFGLQLWCQNLVSQGGHCSPSRPERFDTQTPLEPSHTLCSVNVYRPFHGIRMLYSEWQGHAGMSLSGLTLLTLFMWRNEYIPAEYAHASNVLHPRKG